MNFNSYHQGNLQTSFQLERFFVFFNLPLITKQRSNMSSASKLVWSKLHSSIAFNNNGGSKHAQTLIGWYQINSSVARTLTVLGNTLYLEFGLRTLHCIYELAQLYGYYYVVNILWVDNKPVNWIYLGLVFNAIGTWLNWRIPPIPSHWCCDSYCIWI